MKRSIRARHPSKRTLKRKQRPRCITRRRINNVTRRARRRRSRRSRKGGVWGLGSLFAGSSKPESWSFSNARAKIAAQTSSDGIQREAVSQALLANAKYNETQFSPKNLAGKDDELKARSGSTLASIQKTIAPSGDTPLSGSDTPLSTGLEGWCVNQGFRNQRSRPLSQQDSVALAIHSLQLIASAYVDNVRADGISPYVDVPKLAAAIETQCCIELNANALISQYTHHGYNGAPEDLKRAVFIQVGLESGQRPACVDYASNVEAYEGGAKLHPSAWRQLTGISGTQLSDSQGEERTALVARAHKAFEILRLEKDVMDISHKDHATIRGRISPYVDNMRLSLEGRWQLPAKLQSKWDADAIGPHAKALVFAYADAGKGIPEKLYDDTLEDTPMGTAQHQEWQNSAKEQTLARTIIFYQNSIHCYLNKDIFPTLGLFNQSGKPQLSAFLQNAWNPFPYTLGAARVVPGRAGAYNVNMEGLTIDQSHRLWTRLWGTYAGWVALTGIRDVLNWSKDVTVGGTTYEAIVPRVRRGLDVPPEQVLLEKRFTSAGSVEMDLFLDGLTNALKVRKISASPVVTQYFERVQSARRTSTKSDPMSPSLTGFNLIGAATAEPLHPLTPPLSPAPAPGPFTPLVSSRVSTSAPASTASTDPANPVRLLTPPISPDP